MRVADTPPHACSACFQSKPQMTHVDFEVAWDGPVIEGGMRVNDELVSHVPQPIDDLVVCKDCLADAVQHIKDFDAGGRGELDRLRGELTEARRRSADLAAYVVELEKALAAKPKPVKQSRREPVGAAV